MTNLKKTIAEYQSRRLTGQDLYQNDIIEMLEQRWHLWEFIWEWKDRIVYSHSKNPNLVIKIPKSYAGLSQNEREWSHYLEEESMRCKMWKEYRPNWLARCAFDPELWVLYMQKLIVTKWSDFWVTPDWIIRRFDLNVLNM